MKRYAGLFVSLITVVLGCGGPEWLNFTAPMAGTTLRVGFVNETQYHVSTYFGVYNPLDAQHNVYVKPVILAGGEVSDNFTDITTCRQLDVAGPELRRAAELGHPADITPSDIQDQITFTTDDGTVVGTAPAARFLVGVDYAGNDQIEIHFKQVPGTTDQFTVIAVSDPFTTASQ